jgi:hypothetical protein
MANADRRGPRVLSEVLGELFTVRGYGRLEALNELERAWNSAVGEPYCHQTRVGELRRGVLSVIVAHPTLLEELAAFRKAEILEALRATTVGTAIADIRFRIGPIGEGRPEATTAYPAASEQAGEHRKPNLAVRQQRKAPRIQRGEQNRRQAGDEKAKPGS